MPRGVDIGARQGRLPSSPRIGARDAPLQLLLPARARLAPFSLAVCAQHRFEAPLKVCAVPRPSIASVSDVCVSTLSPLCAPVSDARAEPPHRVREPAVDAERLGARLCAGTTDNADLASVVQFARAQRALPDAHVLLQPKTESGASRGQGGGTVTRRGAERLACFPDGLRAIDEVR